MNNEMRNHEPIHFVAKDDKKLEADIRVFFVDLAVQNIQEQCLWNLAMEVNEYENVLGNA